MILSDRSIRQRLQCGAIFIEPFDADSLQPASYDLRLDNAFLVFDAAQTDSIDVRRAVSDVMRRIHIAEDEAFVLHPGQFALANTREIVGVDDRHVGWLEGKSSLGRLGLVIHATAGFLDPGNRLRMTLELCNLGPLPIKLYPGTKIAQIAFGELDTACERPYGSEGLNSKYHGDLSVRESQMFRNDHSET
ncbi:MAG: dCTP deaminase [Anaerolineae bacterium]